MTSQIGDLLVFNNEEYRLASAPFFQYLNKKYDDYELNFTNTGLIKRHYAEWLIENNKLYLKHLIGSGKVYNKDKFLLERLRLRKLMRSGEITSIENGHLLKKYKAEECWSPITLSLQELFHTSDRVFCDWYTGSIWVGYGEIIEQDFTFGIFSKYSNRRTFKIIEGELVDIIEEVNSNR
jgi:hypothetical protein